MKKFLHFFLFLLFLSSCKMVKTIKLIKKGSVEQTNYTEDIPFEIRSGWAIVPATIHGKTYHFMIDTGAPNVITKELAAELKLKAVVKSKTKDSQGNKDNLSYVQMPDMYLGDICFKEIGAAVADFQQNNVIACLKIDGIIGSNLMRLAFWQMDFEKNTATCSDKLSSFDVPENGFCLNFKPAITGTPKIDIEYGGVMENNITFDTGANSHFSAKTGTYQAISNGSNRNKLLKSYGSASSGLYGEGKLDTSYTMLVDTVKLGNLWVTQQAVRFEKGVSVLGTDFLKNYRVILDWKDNEIHLIPQKMYANDLVEGFGYGLKYADNKLLVKNVDVGSDADEKGVKLGDQILEVNGKDYRNCTAEMWCEIFDKGLVNKESKIATVLFKQGNEERSIVLSKRDLLR